MFYGSVKGLRSVKQSFLKSIFFLFVFFAGSHKHYTRINCLFICLHIELDGSAALERRMKRIGFENFSFRLTSLKKISLVDAVLFLSSDSPTLQPKFVKGSKRYGRRSTPEFIESFSDSPRVDAASPADEEDEEEDVVNNDDSGVPRKCEVRRVVHWCEPSNT